jgi:hypothetical protein
MSNPSKSICHQELSQPPRVSAAYFNPEHPDWQEGHAHGRAAVRQSVPDARKGLTYMHGWLTGHLEARGFSLAKFTAGTVH